MRTGMWALTRWFLPSIWLMAVWESSHPFRPLRLSKINNSCSLDYYRSELLLKTSVQGRDLFPPFCFPCNLSFSHFISSLSIHHSDNQLVFHPAIVVHLEFMSLSLFEGNPFIYITNVVLNYCKSIQIPLKRSMTASGWIMLWMSEIYNALGIFSADWYVVFCWSQLL